MNILKKFHSLFDVHHHIAARVFVSILISVLLTSIILISAYSFSAIHDLTDVFIKNGQSAVDTIAQQIDTVVNNIAQTHVLFFSSEYVTPFLQSSNADTPSYDWFVSYQDALKMLRFCGRSQFNLIIGMQLTKNNNETLQYGSFYTQFNPTLLQKDELERLLLYNGYAFYVSTFSPRDGAVAYLCSQIYNSAFDNLCESLLMPDSGIVLLDAEGNVFRRYEENPQAGSQIEVYLNGHMDTAIPAELHCVKSVSAQTGLTISMILPAMRPSQKFSQLLPWLIPAILFALIAGILFSLGFSRKIDHGFAVMQNNIRLMESHAYSDVAILYSHDEFGQLSRTFAHMAVHIDALIRENRERERLQRELEIQVLRAQISPHFLYNALNSVRHLASMQGMDHIERLTGAIIHLLRAALHSKESLIPLWQEVEYVRNYCEICKYQYLNDFVLDIKVDEAFSDCLLPAMVLQPIVENAIIHGIADYRSDGVIRIHALKRNDSLLICITDNGQGMSRSQIDQLLAQECNTSKRRFSGIGIPNVRQRIKLRFGDKYGLDILSKPGEFTTVKLLLPYLLKETCS